MVEGEKYDDIFVQGSTELPFSCRFATEYLITNEEVHILDPVQLDARTGDKLIILNYSPNLSKNCQDLNYYFFRWRTRCHKRFSWRFDNTRWCFPCCTYNWPSYWCDLRLRNFDCRSFFAWILSFGFNTWYNKKSQYINFNLIIVPTCWIEQENPTDANNPNIFEFMKDGCGVNFLNVATTTPWWALSL